MLLDRGVTATSRCPQCRKPSVLTAENPFRPFCSERCKLIDLGDWMSGRFAIPVEPEGDPDELPPASSGPGSQSRQ